MIDFTDQVAIVTGAGRGLGRLYALELARRGASVIVNDLGGTMHGEGSDASVADAVVDEIVRAGGVAVASHDSVDSPEGGEAIVRTAIDRFGRLDAVVSNAGIFNSVPFEDLSQADWRRMLSVHLDGGFYLSQPAYRAMNTAGYGRFVFISSSGGMFGQPLEAHYAAAKAGLVGLANVIAIEGAQHGILANTVLPFGFSRMVTETVGDPKALEETGFLKVIQPELVVPIVTFLASRACEFTHHNYSREYSWASARVGSPNRAAIPQPTTSRRISPRFQPPSRSPFPARSSKRSSRSAKGWASTCFHNDPATPDVEQPWTLSTS
jgi:NAD(P)-dependent dehydrogenase (short-subunit alcohol dehydrogenase family)